MSQYLGRSRKNAALADLGLHLANVQGFQDAIRLNYLRVGLTSINVTSTISFHGKFVSLTRLQTDVF